MPTTITCPKCEASLKLRQELTPGIVLICPKCKGAIRVPDSVVDVVDGSSTRNRRDREKPRDKRTSSWLTIMVGVTSVSILLLGGALAIVVYLWPSFEKKPPPPPMMVGANGGLMLPPGEEQKNKSVFVKGARDSTRPRSDTPKSKEVEEAEAAEREAKTPTIPDPDPPISRGPWKLDWAGMNVAGMNVGDLPARSAAELSALRWLPPQSDTVIGIDTANLSGKLAILWLMQKIAALGEENPLDAFQRETGFGLKDVDHIIVAGKINFGRDAWRTRKPFPFDVTTYVIQTRLPIEPQKLLQSIKAGQVKRIGGKEIYPLPELRGNQRVYVYIPAERILVVSRLPEEQLGDLLKSDGTNPALAPECLAALQMLDRAQVWAAVAPNNVPGREFVGVPFFDHFRAVLDLPGQVKCIGMALRLQGEHLNFGLSVAGDRAATLAIEEFCTKQGRAALVHGAATLPAGVQPTLAEIARVFQVRNRDGVASATASLSLNSVDLLLKGME